MGRVLFVRVSAVTYDEKAVREAWPFLTDLAWPKPLPVAPGDDDKKKDELWGKDDDWGKDDKDAELPDSPDDAQEPKIAKAQKKRWRFSLPWSSAKPAPKSTAQSKKILPALEDFGPQFPHGVLELVDRLADLEHADFELELLHVLNEYVPKLVTMRRDLDNALADWDVKQAHQLTITIEETLDAAEKECYY